MKYVANYKQDGEFHALLLDSQQGLDKKLSVYEYSYDRAVEQTKKLLTELTLDPNPEIQILLID